MKTVEEISQDYITNEKNPTTHPDQGAEDWQTF